MRRMSSVKTPVALITTLALDRECFAGFVIACDNAVHIAFVIAQQAGCRTVIHHRGAMIGGGHGEVDEQARIVELAVVVDDAAAQFFRFQCGKALKSLLFAEQLRRAEPVLAGKQVVELEADAIERRFPPGVVGNNEGEVVHQVRSVLAQQAALFQRRHDQRNVALFEIAHAAVHQLGAAAAGAFAEIVSLDKYDVEAARCSIDGDAHASGPAADHGDVPGLASLGAFANPAQHFFPAHRLSPNFRPSFWSARPRAATALASRCALVGSMCGSKRTSPWRFGLQFFGLGQNPAARPARYAAPSAVVSVTRGRTTGTPSRSA